MLEQQIEQDIKTALLAGDAPSVSTLRMVKSSLLSFKVDNGKRETGISDDEVTTILAKEAKKRQESADLYLQAHDQARADQELAEKKIIEKYLPTQLSELEISEAIDEVISSSGAQGTASLGSVIGQVKQKLGATADGSVIARLTKEKLA